MFVSEQEGTVFRTSGGGAATDCPHGCIAWLHTFLNCFSKIVPAIWIVDLRCNAKHILAVATFGRGLDNQ